jgi:glycosyltransferase involved in cell wall biosynthesis
MQKRNTSEKRKYSGTFFKRAFCCSKSSRDEKNEYLKAPNNNSSMSLPLVSVVMPVYNSEKYLKEAMDSILSQSYPKLELVIVDNGSSDSSNEIVSSYSDSRIRFLQNEQNFGIVFSRNKGLEAAAGKYVATLDSDDIALPDRLEKQVNFLEAHPDYGLCGTFYHTIDGNGRLLKKINLPTLDQDIQTCLTIGNCFGNSTMMLESKLAKELKYRADYDLVEDYELWYRISKRAKVANLPLCGTYYRVHGSNLSVARMNDMFASVKKIHEEVLTDLEIDFSASELELHANMLTGNIDAFMQDNHYQELESWICKFYIKLSGMPQYNEKLLFELLAEKWIAISYKTKRYRNLLSNRIFPLNRPAYLKMFCERVSGKLLSIK